ncbi:hypothetical protein N7478_000486 [Penicillium angulare]|uniref:uncharacterized protein n=1 Tax=Penicillium angulare TaxID=116970 RepID=UPI00254024A4|nr:uncharacterized protein N7478_000486 [Penicillium angulare]KAJ5291235.1 hypothetical protein N7478_000486 [Penicillium angulare]
MGSYGLESKDGRDIVIVMLVFGWISIASTVLRVISRRMRDVSLAAEDYMMMIATCMVVASTIVVIMTVTKGGVGLHALKPVAWADIEFVLKMIIVCQCLYGVGLAIVKTAMMTLYYKLFGTKKSMRIAIYVTGAIVWLWALSIVLESFLICQPIPYNWNPTIPGGGCGNRNAAFVVAGVLNMVTDLMVMALPIPYIIKLQLPVGRKVGLIVAFSLGLFVSAISMVRVVSLMRINFADVTYTLPIPLMWSIVEEQLAIVAANVPLLRPVFSAITPSRWLGSSDRGTGPSYDFGLRKGSSKNYPLTRMDQGVNKIEVTSHQSKGSRQVTTPRWSDDGVDGRSDTGLTLNGAPPDGIHMWQDFRVDETSSK